MLPRSFITFAGFVAVIAGTYCPLLRPFHLFNWNVYDLNKPYGIVVLIVAIAGLAAVIARANAIVKATAWTSLVLITLLLIAAILKVNTTFSFIPFKGLSKSLTRLIKFKWGWFVLFAGAIATLAGSKERAKNIQYQNL
ncbi:hypothetical protein [Mucilaginibacter agri]|uniref:Uncharacterized protein n=1 Tax=Mucilaginibacter agri TaxID=2695265 RepID=A0A965ZFE5_9SPHI|nr:hypothetical protein [Mucilaginibacter agri]NCD68999.1 hypothetical protein [Mucilaginibacter agri]